jgi:hypothetical protein
VVSTVALGKMMQCPVADNELRSLNQSLGTLLKILLVTIPSTAVGPILLLTTCTRQHGSDECPLFPLLLPVVWSFSLRAPMILWIFYRFRTFRPGGVTTREVARDLTWCWNQFKCILAQQVPSVILSTTVMLGNALIHRQQLNLLDMLVVAWMLAPDLFVSFKVMYAMWSLKARIGSVQRFLDDFPTLYRKGQLGKIEDMCKQLASFEYQEPTTFNEGHICSGETCDVKVHKTLHSLPWFNDQVTCVICLSEFSQSEVVQHPACGHLFHSTCFSEWMVVREPLIIAPMCPFGCKLDVPLESVADVSFEIDHETLEMLL